MCKYPLDTYVAGQLTYVVSNWVYDSQDQGRGRGWSYKFVKFIRMWMKFQAMKLDVLINRVNIQS